MENCRDYQLPAIKIARRIKTVLVSRIALVWGSVKKLSKRVDITGFKEYFNINKTNRIVGFTPNYIGFQPSKPVNFNNVFVKVFNKNFSEIIHNYPFLKNSFLSSCVNFREVFTGSYDSNSLHLKNFFSDDTTKLTALDILNEVKDSPWLQVPELKFSLEDLKLGKNYINFNPESHCGHVTSRLLGTTKKGGSISYAVPLAEKKFELIQQKPTKNYTLWDIFAREKDVNVANFITNLELATRVVLNTEHHEVYLLSYFFQKLMKSIDSFGNNIKFHISGEYDGGKANKLSKRVKDYDFYVDADWSFFDASIDSEFLFAAGAIMFSGCFSVKEEMRVLFHVISSFVTKYVVVPPGIVVELNRGNPSGHPGVTAVNCFVNLIRWIIIGKKIYGNKYYEYMDIEVYGDDAIVMFKYHDNLTKLDDIIKELGFKSEPLVPKLYPCILEGIYIDEGPDFLKRRLSQGSLSWNYKKMFDKLLYQSKVRTFNIQIDFFCNYYYTAPADENFKNFIIFTLNKLKDFTVDEEEVNYIDYKINEVESYNGDRFCANEYVELSRKTPEESLITGNICVPKSRAREFQMIKNVDRDTMNVIKAVFMITELGENYIIRKELVVAKHRSNLYKVYTRFNPFDYKYISYGGIRDGPVNTS